MRVVGPGLGFSEIPYGARYMTVYGWPYIATGRATILQQCGENVHVCATEGETNFMQSIGCSRTSSASCKTGEGNPGRPYCCPECIRDPRPCARTPEQAAQQGVPQYGDAIGLPEELERQNQAQTIQIAAAVVPLVLLAGLGVGGYFWWRSRQEPQLEEVEE